MTISVATVPATFTHPSAEAQTSVFTRILTVPSKLDRAAMGILRLGLVVVLVWIGG